MTEAISTMMNVTKMYNSSNEVYWKAEHVLHFAPREGIESAQRR